jgi:serine/threonine protein kinase
MTPQFISRYEIKAELGRGGMATVYRAHDPRFKRDVAIKVLPAQFLNEPSFRARFEREAHAIAAIEHPGIVPVYDFGEENDLPYLVMRYMSGGSLCDRLKKRSLSLAETTAVLSRLAPALDEMHARGIVHRDIKPANILFDQFSNAYISDFGIARLTEATTTLTGEAIIGTPCYMSPEQARGDAIIDGRSDIYALGAILFEMLTGKTPYEGTTPMGIAMKHIIEPVPRILVVKADLPQGCEVIISTAMAKEKSHRFQTASAMATALEQAITNRYVPGTEARSERLAPISPPAKIVSSAPEPVRRTTHQMTGQTVLPKKTNRVPGWALPAGVIALLLILCSTGALLGFGAKYIGSFTDKGDKPFATVQASGPTDPLTGDPQKVTDPSIFNDDFKDPDSGWKLIKIDGSIIDYYHGSLRIYVDKPKKLFITTPGLRYTDVSLEAEATKVGGPDDNYIGLICRYQDDQNFYTFFISSEGYYAIGKVKNGTFSYLGRADMVYNNAVNRGKTTNRLQADCIRNKLTFYANNIKLADVEDNDFKDGDVGLAAGTFEIFGAEILFDNFVARKPK